MSRGRHISWVWSGRTFIRNMRFKLETLKPEKPEKTIKKIRPRLTFDRIKYRHPVDLPEFDWTWSSWPNEENIRLIVPGYHHELAGSLPGWRTPKPAPPTNRYAMPCVALGYVTARQCSRLPPPRLLRRSMAAGSEYVGEDKLQVLEFLCCERWAVCIPAMYKLKNVTCIDVFPLEKKLPTIRSKFWEKLQSKSTFLFLLVTTCGELIDPSHFLISTGCALELSVLHNHKCRQVPTFDCSIGDSDQRDERLLGF